METVDKRLFDNGVTLPVLERDEWAFIDAESPVGRDIVNLWLTAKTVWALCPDVTLMDAMAPHLVRQCDIWMFG